MLTLMMAMVLLATSGVTAVSAVQSGADGSWKSLRWAASVAALCGALVAAMGLLA